MGLSNPRFSSIQRFGVMAGTGAIQSTMHSLTLWRFSQFLPDVRGDKFVQNNVVCNAVFLFTSCAQNVLALWHVQALTIGQVRRIIVLRHRICSSMSVSSHGRACPLVHKLFISSG